MDYPIFLINFVPLLSLSQHIKNCHPEREREGKGELSSVSERERQERRKEGETNGKERRWLQSVRRIPNPPAGCLASATGQ